MIAWVDTILEMLELLPMENTLIGSELLGGMSFEQVRVRVRVGVRLMVRITVRVQVTAPFSSFSSLQFNLAHLLTL
jgi:hypothetical protein